jgi:hypothetical protein
MLWLSVCQVRCICIGDLANATYENSVARSLLTRRHCNKLIGLSPLSVSIFRNYFAANAPVMSKQSSKSVILLESKYTSFGRIVSLPVYLVEGPLFWLIGISNRFSLSSQVQPFLRRLVVEVRVVISSSEKWSS